MQVYRQRKQRITHLRKLIGVTLLEIMLVLAIAALIIVMSVRYFQSASISQQAVAYTSQLQAIAAAENSISQGIGAYVSSTSLTSLLPAGGLTAPWGGSVTVSSTARGTFTASAVNPTQQGVCTLVTQQLLSGSGGNWTVSFDNGICSATYVLNPNTT